MRFYLLILVLFIILHFSCGEIIDDGATSCIREKIEQFKSESVTNPPRAVYSYLYNGKTVYYITSACCDQFNNVYDINCNVICSPNGGISGAGDGKCTDFLATATNPILIWKDNRK